MPGSVVCDRPRARRGTRLAGGSRAAVPAGSVDGAVIVERIEGIRREPHVCETTRARPSTPATAAPTPPGNAVRPGAGRSSGRLLHGRLLDPRLDILCRDRRGRPLAYAWVEPVPGAHWIGVDQGSYTEVYEVLAGLPVRVATLRGIQLSALARIFRSDAVRRDRKALVRGPLEGGGRRLNSALHSAHSAGADLADGDHEDPHPLPVLGRLLGDQVGASPRPACGARGGFG